MGKGASKKITKIIGLGKKKPSTDEQTSSAEEDVPTCGKRERRNNPDMVEVWLLYGSCLTDRSINAFMSQ